MEGCWIPLLDCTTWQQIILWHRCQSPYCGTKLNWNYPCIQGVNLYFSGRFTVSKLLAEDFLHPKMPSERKGGSSIFLVQLPNLLGLNTVFNLWITVEFMWRWSNGFFLHNTRKFCCIHVRPQCSSICSHHAAEFRPLCVPGVIPQAIWLSTEQV